MQRLVTIYLDSHAYMEGKWVKGTHGDKHGQVEEHLRNGGTLDQNKVGNILGV